MLGIWGRFVNFEGFQVLSFFWFVNLKTEFGATIFSLRVDGKSMKVQS